MKIKILLLAGALSAFSSVGLGQSVPTFNQYSVKAEKVRNVQVNLRSHKDARLFRTNLRRAAKKGVNFAGHYILTGWGCGTNCADYAIIDARSGRVFFPRELAGAGFGFCDLPDDAEPIVFRPDSRLVILSGFKGGDLEKDNSPCGVYYLEWTGTKLREIKFLQKKRREMP
ncbi:MAG: hypothetical protein M3362_13865 [Acidobacteriota bacterium]|nr:hypothetical protein [Acidobacteriota bacterium]